MIKNLDDYIKYLQKNENSLIARIYGIYQIKLKGASPVNFILMKNCVEYDNRICLKKYQLRGYHNQKRFVQRENEEYDLQGFLEVKTLQDSNYLSMLAYRK